jgi:hypothetical protein
MQKTAFTGAVCPLYKMLHVLVSTYISDSAVCFRYTVAGYWQEYALPKATEILQIV